MDVERSDSGNPGMEQSAADVEAGLAEPEETDGRRIPGHQITPIHFHHPADKTTVSKAQAA